MDVLYTCACQHGRRTCGGDTWAVGWVLVQSKPLEEAHPHSDDEGATVIQFSTCAAAIQDGEPIRHSLLWCWAGRGASWGHQLLEVAARLVSAALEGRRV
jgi:hypothetical protein